MSTPQGPENVRSESLDRGYEVADAATGKLFVYAGLLIALLVGALLISKGVIGQAESVAGRGDAEPHPLAAERQIPPAPRLQVTPSIDMNEHLAIEKKMTTSTEWIDREAGIVRIPVERAKELIVERGGAIR